MSDPFIGEIRIFAGSFAPRDYAFCDGSTVPLDQNQSLFAILGTTYGGDGRTTVGLPDLQGKAAMHAGTGPGLTRRRMGEHGGAADVTLSTNNLPSHDHVLNAHDVGLTRNTEASPADSIVRAVTLYASGSSNTVSMASTAVESTGASGAHDNRHPYLALNFIIALSGGFPTQG